MKHILSLSLLTTLVIIVFLIGWFYEIKPQLYNNSFLESKENPIIVTIPLGGNTYVDIAIDGKNEFKAGNHLTIWQYNNCKIQRTATIIEGVALSDGVEFTGDNEICKKFGDYYISVSSDENLLNKTYESFLTAKPYTAECPELTESKRIKTLPDTQLPEEYNVDGDIKIPLGINTTQVSNDKSYYNEDLYLNYNFRYQKRNDAISDASSMVCAISGIDIDWWYDDGNIFIVKSGDNYVCVEQRNYTSCYFMSSNDLSYILLNMGGK